MLAVVSINLIWLHAGNLSVGLLLIENARLFFCPGFTPHMLPPPPGLLCHSITSFLLPQTPETQATGHYTLSTLGFLTHLAGIVTSLLFSLLPLKYMHTDPFHFKSFLANHYRKAIKITTRSGRTKVSGIL